MNNLFCLLEVTLHEFFFFLFIKNFIANTDKLKQGKRERDFVRHTVINKGFIHTLTFWNLFFLFICFSWFLCWYNFKKQFLSKAIQTLFKPLLIIITKIKWFTCASSKKFVCLTTAAIHFFILHGLKLSLQKDKGRVWYF